MKNFKELLIGKCIDEIVDNPYEYGIALAPLQNEKEPKTFQEILQETYQHSSLRDYPYCTHLMVYVVSSEKTHVNLYAMTGTHILTMSHNAVIPQDYKHETLLRKTYISTLIEAVLKHEGEAL